MIWFLLACSPTASPTPAPVLAEASDRATFGTMESLGSHVIQASLKQTTRFGEDPPREVSTTFRLRWQDVDNWTAERSIDGRRAEEIRVVGGKGWTSTGDGAWRAEPDAEPLRVQLTHTWDLWGVATELFQGRVLLTESGASEVEGRPVRTYTLNLGPAVGKGRRVWEPTALSGSVWVDEGTAARLLVDLHGEAVSGGQARSVDLKLAIQGIGLPVVVESPEGAGRSE